jgi:hypothetical protein
MSEVELDPRLHLLLLAQQLLRQPVIVLLLACFLPLKCQLTLVLQHTASELQFRCSGLSIIDLVVSRDKKMVLLMGRDRRQVVLSLERGRDPSTLSNDNYLRLRGDNGYLRLRMSAFNISLLLSLRWAILDSADRVAITFEHGRSVKP